MDNSCSIYKRSIKEIEMGPDTALIFNHKEMVSLLLYNSASNSSLQMEEIALELSKQSIENQEAIWFFKDQLITFEEILGTAGFLVDGKRRQTLRYFKMQRLSSNYNNSVICWPLRRPETQLWMDCYKE